MLTNLTWRKVAVAITGAGIIIVFAFIVSTLVLWWRAEPGNYEPQAALLKDVILALLVAVFEWLRQTKIPDKPIIHSYQTPPSTFSQKNWRRNRMDVLTNVYSSWIEGYLHHTVNRKIFILLDMTYQPNAVSRPNRCLLPSDEPVPNEESIYDIFVKYGRNLLILGEPASGKTTTLLQLAEMLIVRARTDESEPVPVVLNLSSWAQQRGELVDWLMGELLLHYQMARGLSQDWIEQNNLILLLDGLDEVAISHRDDCLAAINRFKEYYHIGLVVCSRTAHYERLTQRLNLATAIQIQPLTPWQIDNYLRQFGAHTAELRHQLLYDENLQKLAYSPLLLTLMSVTYGDNERGTLPHISATLDAKREHLFANYVARIFQHRPLPSNCGYSKKQALQWLVNLAHGMMRHNQSVFHIERLQPSWLPTAEQKSRFSWMVSLVAGCVGGLLFTVVSGATMAVPGAVIVPAFGFVTFLILGFFIGAGFFYYRNSNIRLVEYVVWNVPSFRELSSVARASLKNTLENWKKILKAAVVVTAIGITIGVIYGLLSAHLSVIEEIRKKIPWLLSPFQENIQFIEEYSEMSFVFWITFGLFSACVASMVAIVFTAPFFFWVETRHLFVQRNEANQRSRPNQGIYRSLRNALMNGLKFWLIGGTGFLLFMGITLSLGFQSAVGSGIRTLMLLKFALLWSWEISLLSGLAIGILAGVRVNGGKTVLQHYTLRWLLARAHVLPYPFRDKRLVAYLDAMAERLLLQRVGGGWIFFHRYLLEYFATQHPDAEQDEML